MAEASQRTASMTRPHGPLLRMLMFVGVVGAGSVLILDPLLQAYFANAFLNGVILIALLIGVAIDFWMVLKLNREIAWIENFKRGRHGVQTSIATPRLLAPAATMLAERTDRGRQLSLSTTAMQTLLDGVAARLDEAREVSRYMVGLLVFLGLLGTFWGLMQTVQSIGDVIADVEIGGADASQAIEELKLGLEAPLAGMGTAFSSSLFGLAGSLILGFLGLQAGQAQNRFYNDLEDWFSGFTRLGGAGPMSEGEHSAPAYIQALLEQTADSLESLQRTIARAEESRTASHMNIQELTEKLDALATSMRTEQDLMLKLAEGQQRLQAALETMSENVAAARADETTRAHIRNIDTHLVRLIDQLNSGRVETVQDIRNEIRLLARTIAAIAEGGEP